MGLTREQRQRLQTQIRIAQRKRDEALLAKLEAEYRAELAAGPKYVCMFALPPRQGAQYVSRYGGLPIWDRDQAAVHADRNCQSIKGMAGAEVRPATPGEIAHMGPCMHRCCKLARGEYLDDAAFEVIGERFGKLRRGGDRVNPRGLPNASEDS
jgi:hypothetical protein